MALRIREFVATDGHSPFRSWLLSLDTTARARVQARVLRFETGNLGDCKSVGEGVLEARLMFGAGYRIYFGRDGNALILLLTGGSKASQRGDIRRAQLLWRDYLERG